MPATRFLAACAQLTSTADLERNLDTCARLVAEARGRGAELVVLPENFAYIGDDDAAKLALAETLGEGPISRRLQALAREHRVWIVGGGMPERADVPGKLHNTAVVVAPDGAIASRYRKLHLFDVAIPGGAEFRESRLVAPGTEAVVVELPWATVGLSICYDVRFPELYRALARQGARVLLVPAAFTQHTGKDHWHVLNRARAVENQCYVLAAGQYGRHDARRVSYGHSLIVDPWGTVVAEGPDREAVVVAEIDLAFQDKVRRELPCLEHRKL